MKDQSHPQDADLAQGPLQATMRRRPFGVKQGLIHKVFAAIWILAALSMAALALAEYRNGFLFSTLLGLAGEQLSTFFGLEAETLASLAAQALETWKLPVVMGELAISGIFFICSWYSLRLVARSSYIRKLEGAALLELSGRDKDAPETAGVQPQEQPAVVLEREVL